MNKNMKKTISRRNLKKQVMVRNFVMVALFFAVFIGLIGKLASIIFIDGASYEKRVLNQAIQREGDEYIAFKRGDIMDRNGIILAQTSQVYKLIFDAKLINSLNDDQVRSRTLDLLVQNKVRSRAELEQILVEKKDFNYVVLNQGMTYKDFEPIKKSIDQGQASGLFYEAFNKREYPYPTLAPELLGFVKGDNVGEGGIEEYYNDILIGEVGRQYGVLNNQTIAVDQEVDATHGYQLMLNIDYSIQKYITDAMNDYLKDHNPKSVTIIVADPRNMDILGLKSYPSFSQASPYDIQDLDLPADVEMVEKNIGAIILQKKKKLLQERLDAYDAEQKKKMAEASPGQKADDPAGQADSPASAEKTDPNRPTIDQIQDEEVISPEERAGLRKQLLLQNRWKNIALTNGYEPGSIFKAITYAMAEEENKKNPENYYCGGGLQKANYFIRCHKLSGHGVQTAEQGLTNSCNVVFMEIGAAVGRDLFFDYQHKFGFGAVTGIDLSGETSQRNNLYTKENLNAVQLATSSFGQGFNVTPIQMVTAFSALINGGYLYEPHVVRKVFDAEDNLFEVKDKTLIRQVISEETSFKVRHALKGVVDEGTGRGARVAGYEIGGKTATSEKQPRGNGKYTVSFIGFAPVENPEVITMVIVDEPEGAYQDSRIPAEIFRNCMVNIMPYLHIFKGGNGEDI